MITIDDNGAFTKSFEGLRLKAYQDVAGVWTIGWGSTLYMDGTHVKEGDVLKDQKEADELFAQTLVYYEGAVEAYVKVPLTMNQRIALVDFTYNEGAGALKGSTLLGVLNHGEYANAAKLFSMWNKVRDPKTGEKVVSKGLVARRAAEAALFMKP